MKKLFFLQIKGKQVGGVWFVNKTLGEHFASLGYDVSIISIRNNRNDIKEEYDKRMKVYTINEEDVWEIERKKDVFSLLKKGHIIKMFTTIISRREKLKNLKKDFNNLSNIIKREKPDYIITSHYKLLDAIPKEYFKKVINVQHMSYEATKKTNKQAIKYLKKYNNKLYKLAWLCDETKKLAIKNGITNSIAIYNPIRFENEKTADVVNNKKLITISRLDSKEKRIDLMVDIVADIFKDRRYKDWTFEIYGTGELDFKTMNIIKTNKQIKYFGRTDNPKDKLFESSIYLSTSFVEGFPLSILEANECGVPCITYYFGESTSDSVIEGKTGYIVDFNNKSEYILKLKKLMDNSKLLKEMGDNSKEFAKRFSVEEIGRIWLSHFKNIK